jgi:hypothetical protein
MVLTTSSLKFAALSKIKYLGAESKGMLQAIAECPTHYSDDE